MNGTALQLQIYRGYAKTAAKVGMAYSHYRAASPINALAIGNKLADMPVAFSTLTRPFQVPAKWSDEVWLAYADGRLLAQHDFLVGPAGTFYIGDMQPNLPIQAVRCTHTAVTIKRPGYSTSGPLVQSPTTIASNLPIGLKLKSVNIKTPPGTTAITSGVGVANYLAFIPLANGVLHRNDVITDEEGTEYEVDAPVWTPMGYVAEVRLGNP